MQEQNAKSAYGKLLCNAIIIGNVDSDDGMRDHEAELAHTLSFLVAGAVEGLVGDVVVLDHGSSDGTSSVADAAGCRFYGAWDIRISCGACGANG